jgi:hypothetical protein
VTVMTTDIITTVTARPSWLTHPVQAWRALLSAQADRADAVARAAGLTVEVLPNGVRRYHDPRLDSLAFRHVAPSASDADASDWSPVRLVTTGGWSR